MRLTEKIQTALNETRMLILGAQILLGFQFRGVFQDAYDALPAHLRYLDGVALGLMVCVIGLLIAPGPYHRIVEDGNDTASFHDAVTIFADLALWPFALALGLDVVVVGEELLGRPGAAIAGGGTALLALSVWYVIPMWQRRRIGLYERARAVEAAQEYEATPTAKK